MERLQRCNMSHNEVVKLSELLQQIQGSLHELKTLVEQKATMRPGDAVSCSQEGEGDHEKQRIAVEAMLNLSETGSDGDKESCRETPARVTGSRPDAASVLPKHDGRTDAEPLKDAKPLKDSKPLKDAKPLKRPTSLRTLPGRKHPRRLTQPKKTQKVELLRQVHAHGKVGVEVLWTMTDGSEKWFCGELTKKANNWQVQYMDGSITLDDALPRRFKVLPRA